jgi:protein-tyrosine-phosphatase
MRTRVLFICTANAARSQMAEALLRAADGERFEVFSAGTRPAEDVHPTTLRVLERAGTPVAGQHPKPLELFRGQSFDFVITLADEIREVCDTMAQAGHVVHWSIDDPQAGAATEGNFVSTLAQIRRRVDLFATATASRGDARKRP